MTPIEDFLLGLDSSWAPSMNLPGGRMPLRVIGSCALMLQVDYLRGTKDGDVLQSLEITPAVKESLLEIGGPGMPLAHRCGIYLDVVNSGLPFLPHPPLFHPVEHLNAVLKHFQIMALDVTDVVVSKLKRFNANDRKDIESMANLGHVDPERIAERFKDAVDGSLGSAYADDFPLYAARLNQVERDWLFTDETPFDFEDLDDHL